MVKWDDSSQTDLMFWSDAFDQGWGAMMADQFRSGLWSEEEALYSIYLRELLTVENCLLLFVRLLLGHLVAVFSNNTAALS